MESKLVSIERKWWMEYEPIKWIFASRKNIESFNAEDELEWNASELTWEPEIYDFSNVRANKKLREATVINPNR